MLPHSAGSTTGVKVTKHYKILEYFTGLGASK